MAACWALREASHLKAVKKIAGGTLLALAVAGTVASEPRANEAREAFYKAVQRAVDQESAPAR